MNFLRSLCSKILTAVLVISILAGCSPAKNSKGQHIDAINKIRKSLELPELSLEFVENTWMVNSPGGEMEVANYRDSAGRLYSVDPKTNQIVEIDARAILPFISAVQPALSSEAIKGKARLFAQAVIPNFDSLQPSLQYEEGGKKDNYFFTWYGEMSSGSMNRPFL